MTHRRKRSATGFYHVVVKANARQNMFEDDYDRESYLELLVKNAKTYRIRFHAWCLMSTHAHLLVQDEDNRLSDAMYDVNFRYARAFNARHKRHGVVFKGRYWREAVESESHLISALHYIHRNPETAGICKASQYRWSSYKDYANQEGKHLLTETKMMLSLLGGVRAFVRSSAKAPYRANAFSTSKLRNHLDLGELRAVAGQVLGKKRASNLERLSKPEREIVANRLHERGFSRIDIMGLLGMTRYQLAVCFRAIELRGLHEDDFSNDTEDRGSSGENYMSRILPDAHNVPPDISNPMPTRGRVSPVRINNRKDGIRSKARRG